MTTLTNKEPCRAEFLNELEAIHTEEQVLLDRAKDKKPNLISARMDDYEKLAAAELVLLLRNADTTAGTKSELERSRIAQAGRRVAAELLQGAKAYEKYRPDGDAPEFLREGSVIPLRGACGT